MPRAETERWSSPTESGSLFVYGTLMFPEVLVALIGRLPKMLAASVPDWRAAPLLERVYPGLVPAPGVITYGKLILGLTSNEWTIFDRFEGNQFCLLAIATEGGGSVRSYVLDNTELAKDGTWDAQDFASRFLLTFVATLARPEHSRRWNY